MGSFLESTRTLVALLDAEGRPLASNPAFEALRRDQASAEYFVALVSPSQRQDAQRLLDLARTQRTTQLGQFQLGSAKRTLTYDCLITPAGREATLVFAEPVHTDTDLLSANEALTEELDAARSALADKTSELHAVLAQVDELAHTDSLTFLPNRRSIISELQRQVTYAERYGTSLAVSMMDLDGFKSVNDNAGHRAGDKILGFVARELRDRIREPDEIGRYGGDEFLVILPSSGAAAASEQASRLCQHVQSTPIPLGDATVHLTLSAGIAQFTPGSDSWQSLLERADRALYEAKRMGGNQWLILEI